MIMNEQLPRHRRRHPSQRVQWYAAVAVLLAAGLVAAWLVGLSGLLPALLQPHPPQDAAPPQAVPATVVPVARPVPEPVIREITITAVGDLLMHLPLIQAAEGADGYDFWPQFADTAPLLQAGDLAVANLETTLSGPERRFSGYPMFNSPDELLDAVKRSGIDLLVTANNHSLDRGGDGLRRTLDVIEQAGLQVVGTRRAPEEPPYTVVEAGGLRIATLAYTYGTNGIPIPEDYMITLLDPDVIAEQVAQVRADVEHDLLLVFMHWGDEYRRTPNAQQRDLARWLHELGVDAVIGTHPHVVQPIDVIDGRTPVFYSTGNFLSNQRDRYRDGGIIARLVFREVRWPDGSVVRSLARVDYEPVWVYRYRGADGRWQYRTLPEQVAYDVAAEVGMAAADRAAMTTFFTDVRELLGPSPVFDRLLDPAAPDR